MSDEKLRNNSGTYVGGSITGTGIAVGQNAQAHVSSADLGQITALLAELRAAVEQSAVPASTKNVILNQAVAEMSSGLSSPDPKSGLEKGLSKLNMLVEASGTVDKGVSTIGAIAEKIAKYGGIAFSAAAPFLAKFIGL